jgi:hypothetical protein
LTVSFRIDQPPPGFGPPHDDLALEARLTRAPGATGLMSRRGVGSPKLRRALRALGVTRRESTSAHAVIPTPSGHVMATAVQASVLDADVLREAVRDTAFVERGGTWGHRAIKGRTIDWAEGRRFEVAVFSDAAGVAFYVAGERGTVAFVVERLGTPTDD